MAGCAGWLAFQRQRWPPVWCSNQPAGFLELQKPGCRLSASVKRRCLCAPASEDDSFCVCVWKRFLKSGDEQERERPCRGKGKQQSLEEEIDFSAFYLHPTPLRSTHRCPVGTFSLTAGSRSAHVRAGVFRKVWKYYPLRMRACARTCATLVWCVCEDALVMGT